MPSVPQALYLAWEHVQGGRWQQAEQLCLQVLEVDPDEIDALHLLAVIAGRTGRDSRAIDYLQAVVLLKPELAAAHYDLGTVLVSQRKLPEAVSSFQEAVRLQPDFADAHSNLGAALLNLGRPAEAVSSFQEAVRLQPDFADAHSNLGIALLNLGNQRKQWAAFRRPCV